MRILFEYAFTFILIYKLSAQGLVFFCSNTCLQYQNLPNKSEGF